MPSEILENISLYCIISLSNFLLITFGHILGATDFSSAISGFGSKLNTWNKKYPPIPTIMIMIMILINIWNQTPYHSSFSEGITCGSRRESFAVRDTHGI